MACQWNGNSRYFHQMMKARKSHSTIVKIKDSSSVWIDNAINIPQLFVNDFKLRFKSSLGPSSMMVDLPKIVSLDDNMNLMKPVENHEIKEAVFQIDKFKAPSLNRFGTAFFQDYWHIVQNEVCHTVQSFFQDEKFLKQINHARITLIPKIDNPSVTMQFRPITLSHILYKFIVKILVNRMRQLLVKLINLVQSAFIPRRSIHDNVLLAHQVITKFNSVKGKKFRVGRKLDMEKYDDKLNRNSCLTVSQC